MPESMQGTPKMRLVTEMQIQNTPQVLNSKSRSKAQHESLTDTGLWVMRNLSHPTRMSLNMTWHRSGIYILLSVVYLSQSQWAKRSRSEIRCWVIQPQMYPSLVFGEHMHITGASMCVTNWNFLLVCSDNLQASLPCLWHPMYDTHKLQK